MTKKNFSWS